MTDTAYIVSRMLENKIAIAENNNQNHLLVTLEGMKEILSILEEQQAEIERLKGIINHDPDCANAEHDSGGCLGYSVADRMTMSR